MQTRTIDGVEYNKFTDLAELEPFLLENGFSASTATHLLNRWFCITVDRHGKRHTRRYAPNVIRVLG